MSHPYIRLMRLHQPTGIWLLLWPCWWALAMAASALPDLKLMALFFAGAVVMRGAGCIFNDIVDRKYDALVERTRSRPLASGEVALTEAIILLLVLLLIGLNMALLMKPAVLLMAAASLVLVAAYPFMKRITWWPQAFLGFTFNWGALMGWVAATGKLEMPAMLLYAGGVAWTLGYDTIYAFQDQKDDRKIGVKSTALLLRTHSRQWIGGFYAVALGLWLLAGAMHHSGWPFYCGIALAAGHFAWQVHTLEPDSPPNCMRLFRSNMKMGWLLFAGLWADGLYAIVTSL